MVAGLSNKHITLVMVFHWNDRLSELEKDVRVRRQGYRRLIATTLCIKL